MNTATHTPTPWNVTRDENDARALIRDGNFMRVAECGRAFVPGIAEANAAFIVRACNAHDELVATLKFAKESIVQNRTLDEARNDRALNEAMVAVENRISAALAKAGA